MKAFACPQCGASLESEAIKTATVECPYCHSAVIVPAELRPPPPTPAPVLSGYQPVPEVKQPFSFQGCLAILCVSVFVFLLFILILPSKSKPTDAPYYVPPTLPPSMFPKATPTPYVFTFGGEGTGPGLFQDAQDIAVDNEGNIYVSDGTLRIQKFDSAGKFLTLWTIPSSTEYVSKIRGGPDRLLADRLGHVFVVVGGVILKFDGADGSSLASTSSSDYVYDAALKADGGSVIVTGNSDNDGLVLMDAKGKVTKRIDKFITTQLENPISVEAVKVAVDGVGNIFGLYAIGSIYGQHSYNYDDLAVFRFTGDGKYINRFGGGGNQPGQFESPNAIAVDNQSRIYVCDHTKGINVFAADGRFLETLKTPVWVEGMAFDSDGHLFIVGDNKVSRLDVNK